MAFRLGVWELENVQGSYRHNTFCRALINSTGSFVNSRVTFSNPSDQRADPVSSTQKAALFKSFHLYSGSGLLTVTSKCRSHDQRKRSKVYIEISTILYFIKSTTVFYLFNLQQVPLSHQINMPRNGDGSSDNGPIEGHNIVHGNSGDVRFIPNNF